MNLVIRIHLKNVALFSKSHDCLAKLTHVLVFISTIVLEMASNKCPCHPEEGAQIGGNHHVNHHVILSSNQIFCKSSLFFLEEFVSVRRKKAAAILPYRGTVVLFLTRYAVADVCRRRIQVVSKIA